MSTLLQMYRKNKLVLGLSKKIFNTNLFVFIQELNELAPEFKKEINRLIKNKPVAQNAYIINNMIYIADYISTYESYLWSLQCSNLPETREKLSKVTKKFNILNDIKKNLLFKLEKSAQLIMNEEDKNIFLNYSKVELNKLTEKKSYIFNNLQNELRIMNEKYVNDIAHYRSSYGTGFAVLNPKNNNDWVSVGYLNNYLDNAKMLSQKGPTIMIDQNDFLNNLGALRNSKDRESFFLQATKNTKINNLWNRMLVKKAKLAQSAGYSNYFDFAVSKNILDSKEKVQNFLKSNLKKLKPSYENTLKEMTHLAQKDGCNTLNVYDINYYFNKIDKGRYCEKNCFRLENVLEVLGNFFTQNLNISITFKKIKNNGVTFLISLNDLEKNKKGTVLLSNLDKNNYALRGVDYFDSENKSNIYSFISVDLEDSGHMNFNDVGVLCHEFGHVLQNFVCADKNNNLEKEVWETVEVPSLFLETLCKSYLYFKNLDFYENGSNTSNKLSLHMFNKMSEGWKVNDFNEYMENYKFLIMVEIYSKSYDELKAINPSVYLNEKLKTAKIPYLWTDDYSNFIAENVSDYGAMPYIYGFSQKIVDKLIEKITKNDMIDNTAASINYIFRNVLTNESGDSSINKLKKIYKESKL